MQHREPSHTSAAPSAPLRRHHHLSLSIRPLSSEHCASRPLPVGVKSWSRLVLILDVVHPPTPRRQTATTAAPRITAFHFTMDRTPSPPRRVHTPPAPLHGDDWEPFSPRRSSRVAAKRRLHLEQTDPARTPRTRRDVTPPASSRKTIARTSNFTLSPPTSPATSPKRTPHSTRRALFRASEALDSDSDQARITSGSRFLASMAPGMLPTPAKTPRKRVLHSESIKSTARVLFAPRPTVEEATPRKARKYSKNVFSLNSFEEEAESSKIEIYTDSKERIPTADEDDDEENPFVIKKGKGKAKSKVRAKPTPQRKKDAKAEEMEEAVNREEGMIFLFRGKKVFRKFHDDNPSDAPTGEDEEASADDFQLLRAAGPEARRPLTRSSIKPKLLFQEEIRQRKLENGEFTEDEEEATTDIETPVATPSRGKGKMIMSIADSLQEATPPPTVRKIKRGMFTLSVPSTSSTNYLQKSPSMAGRASSLHTAPAALRAEPSAAAHRLCARWRRRLAVSTPHRPCPLTASNGFQSVLDFRLHRVLDSCSMYQPQRLRLCVLARSHSVS